MNFLDGFKFIYFIDDGFNVIDSINIPIFLVSQMLKQIITLSIGFVVGSEPANRTPMNLGITTHA